MFVRRRELRLVLEQSRRHVVGLLSRLPRNLDALAAADAGLVKLSLTTAHAAGGMSGSEAQLHQTSIGGSQGIQISGQSREQSYDVAAGLFQHQTQFPPPDEHAPEGGGG